MKIYEYPLMPVVGQKVSLPLGAEVLSVQVQGGELILITMIKEWEQFEVRTFSVYSTGYTLPESIGRYIDTAQIAGKNLCIFEVELP